MNPTTETPVTPADQKSPPVETVFCRLHPDKKAALRGLAEDRGMTINGFVSHMLDTFIRASAINEREQIRVDAMLLRLNQARTVK